MSEHDRTQAEAIGSSAPRPPSSPPSRRGLLRGALGGAAALGLGGRAVAQSAQGLGSMGRAPRWRKRDALVTLIERTTYGYTRELHQEARTRGHLGFLEWQLAPEAIDDSALDAMLVSYSTLTMTPKQIFDTYGPPDNGIVPILELRDSSLLRAIYSKRQLHERMVEFWTDHFNVYLLDGPIRYLKMAEDRDVIRAHALGRFKDLLVADAKSAAMLFYLNNNTNVAGAPNENYAREVMELHTLGVDGPYHETDVRELARCFTGWTFLPFQFQNFGDFFFRAVDHDTGEKSVLDVTIPAGGGVSDGETMLEYLADHPATAAFVGRKLARFLIGYEPSQALVDEVAATYLASGGDIKEMIRTILSPANLEAAEPWEEPKLKRPRRFVVGLIRALGAQTQPGQLNETAQRLATMGQAPFAWETPDGYPDNLETWGSTVLPRWEFASDLAANQLQGVIMPGQVLLQNLNGASPSEVGVAISRVLTGGTMTVEEVEAVQAYVDNAGTLDLQTLREAYALAASSPSYQWF